MEISKSGIVYLDKDSGQPISGLSCERKGGRDRARQERRKNNLKLQSSRPGEITHTNTAAAAAATLPQCDLLPVTRPGRAKAAVR